MSSDSSALLIYGATGHSGRLVARSAMEAGLRPLLAGRDRRGVAALADGMGLGYRVAHLDDPAALDTTLRGVAVVVNTAGPFSTRRARCWTRVSEAASTISTSRARLRRSKPLRGATGRRERAR